MLKTVFSLDWLSLTIHKPLAEVMKYVDLLGISETLIEQGHGTKGFSRLHVGAWNFRLGSEPASGEYCTLFFSGETIRCVGFSIIHKLLVKLLDDARAGLVRFNVSRLDLAFDTQAIKAQWVYRAAGRGEFVTLAKTHSYAKTEGSERDGVTTYFGTRHSSCMLRVYHKIDGFSFGTEAFTRFELQMRDERALACIVELMALPLSAWANHAAGWLIGFVKQCDKRWWRSFSRDVVSAWFSIKRVSSDVDRIGRWLRKQVVTSMATYFTALSGGDVELISNLFREFLLDGRRKMTRHHDHLVATYQFEQVNRLVAPQGSI